MLKVLHQLGSLMKLSTERGRGTLVTRSGSPKNALSDSYITKKSTEKLFQVNTY